MNKINAPTELIDESEILLFDEEEFHNWVLKISNLDLNLDDTKKVSKIIRRYKDDLKDSSERKASLEADSKYISLLKLSKDEINNVPESVKDILNLLIERNINILKKLNIVQHQCFPGIPDLGSPVLVEINDEFNITNFRELTKAVAMLHNRNIYEANYEWMIDIKNPSLSDCVCFKEDAEKLDNSDNCNIGFLRDAGYLPHKDWIVEHTKNIVAIANVYLNEPLRYYKAYVDSHRETIKQLDLGKDLVSQIIESRDIELETTAIVLIDMIERGFNYEDVGLGKDARNGK